MELLKLKEEIYQKIKKYHLHIKTLEFIVGKNVK